MQEHAEVGSRFVTITNHTTYSFGIDDQEFMTAFECEEPADFLAADDDAARDRGEPLHGARHADLRRHARGIRAILDSLDGAAARVGSGS